MNVKKSRMQLIVGLSSVLAFSAHADWPEDRPIEVVVAYAPGGSTDVMARAMEPYLEKQLGADIAIINRPGAAGEITYSILAKAKPDGYTLAFINTPGFLSTRAQRKVSYDPTKIKPLARIVDDPSILVVKDSSPYKSLVELVEAAKQKPGTISIGTSGIGTDDHLALIELQRVTGAVFTHVPFNGTGETRTALLGGHISAGGMNVSEYSKDDGFRGLVQYSDERFSQLQSVPTAKEQNINLRMSSERGMAAPAGLTNDIHQKLSEAIRKVLENPEFVAKAKELALPISYLSGEEWEAQMPAQLKTYQELWRVSPWVQ